MDGKERPCCYSTDRGAFPCPNSILAGSSSSNTHTHTHLVASPALQTQGGSRESRIQRGSFSNWLEKLGPPTFKTALQKLALPACLPASLEDCAMACKEPLTEARCNSMWSKCHIEPTEHPCPWPRSDLRDYNFNSGKANQMGSVGWSGESARLALQAKTNPPSIRSAPFHSF